MLINLLTEIFKPKIHKVTMKIRSTLFLKNVLNVLWCEGFINGYIFLISKGFFRVFLKWFNRYVKQFLISVNYKYLLNVVFKKPHHFLFILNEKGFFSITNLLKQRLGSVFYITV